MCAEIIQKNVCMLKRGSREHREQGRAEMDQCTVKRRARSAGGWGSFRGKKGGMSPATAGPESHKKLVFLT